MLGWAPTVRHASIQVSVYKYAGAATWGHVRHGTEWCYLKRGAEDQQEIDSWSILLFRKVAPAVFIEVCRQSIAIQNNTSIPQSTMALNNAVGRYAELWPLMQAIYVLSVNSLQPPLAVQPGTEPMHNCGLSRKPLQCVEPLRDLGRPNFWIRSREALGEHHLWVVEALREPDRPSLTDGFEQATWGSEIWYPCRCACTSTCANNNMLKLPSNQPCKELLLGRRHQKLKPDNWPGTALVKMFPALHVFLQSDLALQILLTKFTPILWCNSI